jgi:hypothetical protein
MIPIIKIHRDWQDTNQTLGSCKVLGDNNKTLFASISLERGWRNNENNISCIPAGMYDVVIEWSNRFKKDLWEIKGVPNRAETKFHAANYWFQLNGCIALGQSLKKLNADEYLDITNSVKTMDAFHQALKPYKKAILIITTEPRIK